MYLFPINIQQYTITVTSTICYFYPQLGNPCITQTYTGTNTNTLTTSTGTTCGFVGYLSCILSQQSSSSTGNTPASIQLGFLAVIFVLLGVIIISGITVVSSGLNAASIYIIFKVMGYTLLWLALSGLAEPIFYGSQQSIPYPFGSLLYLGLSLSFLLGVIGVV